MMSPWIKVFILAMLPISELRGAIPYGIYQNLPIWNVIALAIAGNMVPVPLILLFLKPVENMLRKWRYTEMMLNKIFSYTRKRAERKVEKWESLALVLFVAIPLPVTGAWTGSLIAYLFGLDFKKSIVCIFAGVLIASAIVSIATLAGIKFLVNSIPQL